MKQNMCKLDIYSTFTHTFVNKSLVNYKIVCIGYIREHVACGRLHITKVRFMKKYINEKWPVKLILLSPFEV